MLFQNPATYHQETESIATHLKPGWDVVIALMNKNSGSHIASSNARSLGVFSQEARPWNPATIV